MSTVSQMAPLVSHQTGSVSMTSVEVRHLNILHY